MTEPPEPAESTELEAPSEPPEPEASTDPPEQTPSSSPRATIRPIAALFLVLAVVVGGTVLFRAVDRTPGASPPPQLTAQEREAFASRLAPVDAAIDGAIEAAATLAAGGRDVLTSTRSLDPVAADVAIASGSQASSTITALHSDLVGRREALTTDIDPTHLGVAELARLAAIDRAIAATTQLPVDWTAVVGATSGPLDLVRAIQAHDARVAQATSAARGDDLPGAIAALEDAQRLLVPAHAVRDSAVATGADVTTLDDLLARLDTYDDALERLYTQLVASGGAVTDAIRGVYAEVEAAQASLPRNTDALVLIVSDLAGPSVTESLVDIETQRRVLADAVATRPDASGR
jgi:hypothetical protein